MFDDLSFGGVGSVGTSRESDANPTECSGQGNEEQHAEEEDDEAVDLLAHDVDPYEDAMCDDVDGGFHTNLPLKPQSFATNIPHGEVCIYFTCLLNLKSDLHLLVNTFCLPQLSVFGSFPYMNCFYDRYSLYLQDVVIWMWQLQVRSMCQYWEFIPLDL